MSSFIINTTLLVSPWNRNFDERDFMINSDTPLRIIHNGSWVVLFYDEQDLSKEVLQVWSKVSQVTIGPQFASCNLRFHTKVATSILTTSRTNPSLQWTEKLRVPFILSYNNGWPTGKYTGKIDMQAIMNWALVSPLGAVPEQSIESMVKAESKVAVTEPVQTQIKEQANEPEIPKILE